MATAPPSASCSGSLQHRPVARRQARRVERRQPAEQAERRLRRRARARRAPPRRRRPPWRRSHCATASPFAACSKTFGAKPPKSPGLAVGGEFDDVARVVAEHRQQRVASAARPARMPSCASSVSSSRSRPMRAPLPWSPTMKPQPPMARAAPSRAHHVGGAGAEDGDGAVAGAERAFERDQRVGLDARRAEGQDRLELLAHRCRHWLPARPSTAGVSAISAGSSAGVDEGQPRRLDDVGARAGQIGADVGGAALAAADDLARRRSQALPGSSCRRHRCRAQNRNGSPPARDNTNKIPIAKT